MTKWTEMKQRLNTKIGYNFITFLEKVKYSK